jgi:glucose/arabinose dehydrogenase
MKYVVVLVVVLLSPAAAAAQLRSELYVSGLSLPLELVQDPVQPGVQYVVEQGGRIRVLVDGVLQAQDFLDLSGAISDGGERGLLGMAFAPDYAASRRFYVNFTNPDGHTVVARFERSPTDALRADPASRFDLRWGGGSPFIAQPFTNHNGGHLEFGPDDYLYIALGDGGSSGDPQNNAQNPNTLLGKILRIDVLGIDANDPIGYRIPADNPFAGGAALPEIWSFGYRNPWKFTFDRAGAGGGGTGALISGDVGQGAFEEVNYEPAGAGGRNYGWRLFEGFAPFSPGTPPAFLPLTEPILAYGRSDGQAVTGGYVYRGASLGAGFFGRYFYADFVSGRVWSVSLTIDGAGEATASAPVEHTAELGGSSLLGNISAFGVDASGELYLLSFNGTIRRILLGGSAPPPAGGLFRLTITPPTGGSIFAPGIQCGVAGGSCVVDLPAGIPIGLEALAATGFLFAAWTGDADCLDGFVIMTSAIGCSATFTPGGPLPPPPPPPPPSGTRRLTVVQPTGGTILGPGIVCGTGGSSCVIDFPAGLTIGLEAVPDAGASFSGWSSDCADGLVVLTADRTCSPSFSGAGGGGPQPPPPPPPPSGTRRLTVVRPSGGRIVGPAINCGTAATDCVVDLPAGIVIGLEAVPDPGSSFVGWSSECPAGLVMLDDDRTCAPTFAGGGSPPPPPPPGELVRLTIVATSGGTVFGAGIVCGDEGSTCTVDVPAGLPIGLEAVPTSGFEFLGWSGGGCGPLVIVDTPRTCTATFSPAESTGAPPSSKSP